jgi:hypothetical protein
VVGLLVLGCGESAPPPAPAPASIAPATPQTQAPATSPAEIAQREARFDARPSVPLPAQLPKAWRTALTALHPKFVSARVLRQTRADGVPAQSELQLVFRLFGRDADLDGRVKSALKPWPGARLEIDRVKGVEPRQSHYTVRFASTSPEPTSMKDCRTPPPVELPREAPRWLDRFTNARSTRRRIAVEVEQTVKATQVRLWMLYRNGYALDEAKTHFRRFAKAAGYQPGEADAPWRDSSGHTVGWQRTDDDFRLGCRVAGPILRFDWVAPRR